jgi:CBS domain containing-hemolysin-like protein
MITLSLVLSLLVCAFFSAFFSGLETGLLSANPILLDERKREGVLGARAATFLLDKPERLLGTILIGNNIVNISAAVLFTGYLNSLGLPQYIIVLGIISLTIAFLIFGEIIPKSFFRQYADSLAIKISPVLIFFYFLFMPVYIILNFIVKIFLFVTRQHKSRREEVRSRNDLRYLISLIGKKFELSPLEQRIITDIFDFREQTAREVMIPYHRLPVINVNQSLKEAANVSLLTGLRFMPVYELRTDNMIGYIDTIDLLWSEDRSMREILRKGAFYPETKPIPDLLLDMNKQHLDVAFLSDEYGGIAGMITHDQIIGEVLGYLANRGVDQQTIQKLNPNHFIVSGAVDLEDLAHELGITFNKRYNNTIGGYICEQLGIIPKKDTVYSQGSFTFKVLDSDERSVKKIEINKVVKTEAT